MLRSVGHVLHKVDANTSAKHKLVINEFWQSWRSAKIDNWIFYDFIEQERNDILKLFSFGAQIPTTDGDIRSLAYGATDLDATQLFREAVYWWRFQLRAMETQLSQS